MYLMSVFHLFILFCFLIKKKCKGYEQVERNIIDDFDNNIAE